MSKKENNLKYPIVNDTMEKRRQKDIKEVSNFEGVDMDVLANSPWYSVASARYRLVSAKEKLDEIHQNGVVVPDNKSLVVRHHVDDKTDLYLFPDGKSNVIIERVRQEVLVNAVTSVNLELQRYKINDKVEEMQRTVENTEKTLDALTTNGIYRELAG